MEDSGRLPGSLEESNQAKALTVRDRISDDVSPPLPGGPAVYHLSTLHRYSVHLSDYTPGEPPRTPARPRPAGPASAEGAGGERGAGLELGPRETRPTRHEEPRYASQPGTPTHPAGEHSCATQPGTPTPSTAAGEHSCDREDRWRVAGPGSPGAEDCSQRLLLFALANVIRRAIIVLTGGPEGPGASSSSPWGIYLPSLWDGAQCHPYPVVLGSTYPWQRFAPLVTAGSAQDGGLPSHRGGSTPGSGGPWWPGGPPAAFPRRGGWDPLSCLRAYLQLQTLSLGNRTAYAARLNGRNLPESLSLVQDYFSLANHVCGQADQEVRERGDRAEHSNGDLRPRARPSSSSLPRSSPGSRGPGPRPAASAPASPGPGLSSRGAGPRRLRHTPGVPLAPGASPAPPGRALAETSCAGGADGTKAECETPAPRPPGPLQDPRPPARASPEREGSPAGRGCLTPGCVFYGSAQQAGYCTMCYCIQNETPARPHAPCTISFLLLLLPPPPPPPPSPRPLQLCSTLRAFPRCLGAACDMLGNPAFQGVCERCFLAGHQGAAERQAPAAWPASQRNEQGSRQYHRGPSEPHPPSSRTIAAHGEGRRSPSGSLGNAQALPQLHRPRTCLGRGCSNFGNSKCKGLCNSCYRSHN
ncbi:hypothetical protein COCON_G00000840 [Conger conger]|uniref:A20-type domain-containing protein n=1 Tax=Conger conger TaxID=82655 RepID=A0A9Q1E0H3_CONCO|nr:hypothetical protein COCON_G00000840 [Conger conger]